MQNEQEKPNKPARELRIPLVIELDDATLRALVGIYREAHVGDSDVNPAPRTAGSSDCQRTND